MGKGVLIDVSRHYKLNVRSPVALERVSINNVRGIMMWGKYFMEAQGYTINNNVSYQDNNFTLLLAKKGCMVADKANKHVNDIKNINFPYH